MVRQFIFKPKTPSSTTRDIIEDVLKIEADCQAIQIVYNFLPIDFNQLQEEERKRIIPNFGKNILI